MNSLFLFRENVHNIQILSNITKKTVRYSIEAVSCRSPVLWVSLPQDYKSQLFYMLQTKSKNLEF